MARKDEDFDEFCDPNNPITIKFDEVKAAAKRIEPNIMKTPCTPSHCQQDFAIRLYYKIETLHSSGSFKERGSANALETLHKGQKNLGVAVASVGNSALSLCHQAHRLNIPVVVVVPKFVAVNKIQQFKKFGARVYVYGSNLVEAQRYCRSLSREKGVAYINGRDHPDILHGYGTIALEILEQVPFVDAIIVPVGSGGLVAAVATVVKHIKPDCLIYGVNTENMPVFFNSLENETPLSVAQTKGTIADNIAVTKVGVNSFANAIHLIDKMLLVNEDSIARSMLHLFEREHLIVEGAGACGLATIIGDLVPELKLKTVVCILSGGNIDNIPLSRCLERGLAAEGRLVKFSVGIKDNTSARAQLMKLLYKAGYNVLEQFQDNVWVVNDIYNVELKLVCETKNLHHGLELKRIIERAYPCTTTFETDPFNDKRSCPCYLKKKF